MDRCLASNHPGNLTGQLLGPSQMDLYQSLSHLKRNLSQLYESGEGNSSADEAAGPPPPAVIITMIAKLSKLTSLINRPFLVPHTFS
jgi:hypothetical protein